MKEKTCKICKEKFRPERQMQTICSYGCLIEYTRILEKRRFENKKKEARKELKQFNDKDITVQKQLAQKVFNTYIRMRDKDLPCISCGTTNPIQYHAGHYKPAGNYSYLRFNEDNVHKQCSVCNNHLSGNLVAYRENLIKKIGLERLEALEVPNQIVKFKLEDYHEIIKTYRKKLKELKSI